MGKTGKRQEKKTKFNSTQLKGGAELRGAGSRLGVLWGKVSELSRRIKTARGGVQKKGGEGAQTGDSTIASRGLKVEGNSGD